MRKPSANSTATKVRRLIERGGEDRLWSYPDFSKLPTLAVAAALSRLSKLPNPLVTRVRKGIYYVPKKTMFGLTKPDLSRVLEHVMKHRGVEISPTGLDAYNGLGLTSQVSSKIKYRIRRPSRTVGPGSHFFAESVRMSPPYRKLGVATSEFTALDALKDLHKIPDATPDEVLGRIVSHVSSGRLSFSRLARLASHESPRVRALVGAIGDRVGKSSAVTSSLKKSLNPLTTFKLNLGKSLPNAATWHIR
jgi:uncharacterized protein DUF6088